MMQRWIQLFIGIVLLLLIIKSLVIEPVIIKNQTMEKTLKMGERVLVNKLAYGPRLPITLLTVPFLPHYYLELIQLPVLRLPGFHQPEANDLIAFNFPAQHDPPIDKKSVYVKRLTGLPGDTLQIVDKKLYVNGKPFAEPPTLKFTYRVTSKRYPLPDSYSKEFKLLTFNDVENWGLYECSLTPAEADSFEKDSLIRNIRIQKDYQGENATFIFPVGFYHPFNKDFFGPLIIPFKGMQVFLDTHSLELFATLIELFEKNELVVKNYKIYINGSETSVYTFKQDYYFVLDDNRDNANDSRYWGFLPKNHIIGKVVP